MSSTWFLVLLLAIALLIPTAYAGKIGAPWAPTRLRAIKRAFDELEIGETDTIVDLGAGDGKVLIEAARRGATAVGFELSPIMWLVAWLRALTKQRVRVRLSNFYRRSLPAETTVIFVFLMPENMNRLHTYLKAHMGSNARYIVAYAFPFKTMEPLVVFREHNCAPVYVYDAKEVSRNQ